MIPCSLISKYQCLGGICCLHLLLSAVWSWIGKQYISPKCWYNTSLAFLSESELLCVACILCTEQGICCFKQQFIQRYHSSTTAKWKLWLHSLMIINHNPLTQLNTIFDTCNITPKIKLITQTYYSEVIHMEFSYFCLISNCLH